MINALSLENHELDPEEGLRRLSEELRRNSTDDFIKVQYKLVIDATFRLADQENQFTFGYLKLFYIFLPFLTRFMDYQPDTTEKDVVFISLMAVCFFIFLSWLIDMKNFKNTKKTNYLMIELFEKHFPTSAFSTSFKLIDTFSERKK